MSEEILSAEEIEALLSSVKVSEDVVKEEVKKDKKKTTKSVRVYDFSAPDKFSKDQIRTLQMLHEGFNRLINSSLSTYLRTVVQVELVSVGEQSYDSFIKGLSSPTIIGVFNMSPLKGSAIIEISPKIIYVMFDRLLGGKGITKEDKKEITDIEQSVIEGVLVRILGCLKDAWANIISLQPHLEMLETNPGFCQIISPNERVVLLALDIKIGESAGSMNLCLPYVVLEPIVSKLSAQLWFSGAKSSTLDATPLLKKRLEKVVVPFIVDLGEIVLSLREVLNLKTGDVIRLSQSINNPLKSKVSDKTKFLVTSGKRGSKLAVQVLEKITEGGRL